MGQININHSPMWPTGFAISEEQTSRRYRPVATRHPSLRRGRRTRRSRAGNLRSCLPIPHSHAPGKWHTATRLIFFEVKHVVQTNKQKWFKVILVPLHRSNPNSFLPEIFHTAQACVSFYIHIYLYTLRTATFFFCLYPCICTDVSYCILRTYFYLF